jgi:hypothetical protein
MMESRIHHHGAAASETQDASAPSAETLLHVEEAASATFLAGELFARKFHGPPPDFPVHYVCFYRSRPTEICVAGYVHCSAFEASYLYGGLVIDERLYRRMPEAHRIAMRTCGGIARYLMKTTCDRLGQAAMFAYVGDARSERVLRSVGFAATAHKFVMARWPKPFPEPAQRGLAARVASLGPF